MVSESKKQILETAEKVFPFLNYSIWPTSNHFQHSNTLSQASMRLSPMLFVKALNVTFYRVPLRAQLRISREMEETKHILAST